MQKNKRVVITGIGPLASTGIGKDAFWEGILKKRTGLLLEEVNIDGEAWDKFPVHRIKGFNINEFGIDKNKIDEIKAWKEGDEILDLFFMIASVKLALNDSQIEYNENDNNIGLIVTHENPGLEQYFTKIINIAHDNSKVKREKPLSKKEIFDVFYKSLMKSSYELQTFMPLFHIAKTFNIHGYSLFLNNACASGAYGIEAASEVIKSGKCPVVILTAADCPQLYKYLWFKELGMSSKKGKIMPFSKDADGFVLGDGAIALVLEDFEHAKKRKANIYAEYLGGGFSLESWKVTIPAVGSNFYQNAIMYALESSNISKDKIDLICAHGVGNTLIDRYEAKAISDIFKSGSINPLVTAFKSYIGHTLGASALLETAILLLCLNENTIVPLLNCEDINTQLGINLATKASNPNLESVMKTCCAFAGYDAALIFRKVS